MYLNAQDATVANWVCASLSLTILIIRLLTTRYRDKKFDAASYLVMASLVVGGGRVAVVYYYLKFGTAADAIKSKQTYFDHRELANIKAGSILSLVSRLMITTFYWLQIGLLLLFYSSIVREYHWKATIKVCWVIVGVTYVGVALSTFLEYALVIRSPNVTDLNRCHPFHLYYQIHPNPGHCVKAYAQLFTQCLSNITLDLILLAISLPMLRVRNRSWPQTLRVACLFTLGFFTVIVTCLRIRYIMGSGSSQPVRSFWASIQMLTSSFVANAPTIYGCYQVITRKRDQAMLRRASRPEMWPSITNSSINRPLNRQSPNSITRHEKPGDEDMAPSLDFITTTDTTETETDEEKG